MQDLRKVWEEISIRCGMTKRSVLVAVADARLGRSVQLFVEGRCPKTELCRRLYDEAVFPFAKIRKVSEVKKLPLNLMGKLVLSEQR